MLRATLGSEIGVDVVLIGLNGRMRNSSAKQKLENERIILTHTFTLTFRWASMGTADPYNVYSYVWLF